MIILMTSRKQLGPALLDSMAGAGPQALSRGCESAGHAAVARAGRSSGGLSRLVTGTGRAAGLLVRETFKARVTDRNRRSATSAIEQLSALIWHGRGTDTSDRTGLT